MPSKADTNTDTKVWANPIWQGQDGAFDYTRPDYDLAVFGWDRLLIGILEGVLLLPEEGDSNIFVCRDSNYLILLDLS